MTDKKYFCYEVYKNLSIWSHNGKLNYNPCSLYSEVVDTANEFDLDNTWNSAARKKLIWQIQQDLPLAGCGTCYRAEEAGIVSRRQNSTRLYEEYHNDTTINDNGPTGIDYSVGNLCNLKCMICGPHNSSAWLPDALKIEPSIDISQFKYEKHNQIEVIDPKTLKNLKSVHFHGGGEPLLSNNHINLLKAIKDQKGLQDLRVCYNTNGTMKVSDDILYLWSECKLVELYFSIDDVGTRFEYQRTGASWQEVVDNLSWYKQNMPDNHLFNINCVWSYLNIYYLDELFEWHKQNFHSTRFGDPVNLIYQKASGMFSIPYVSSDVKNVLLNKFLSKPELTQLISSLQVSNKTHTNFWKFINKLDAVRNNSFSTICPEWSKLL